MDRRETVLDAAIDLLGRQGARALTHRAVDAASGLPVGSTSNLFRSRDALLDGVVDRIVARETAAGLALIEGGAPASPQELARALARLALVAAGTNRTLTLARYAVLVESGQRPGLRAHLHRAGAGVSASAGTWLRAAGSLHPDRDAHVLANYWTGLVLHELADPAPRFDPEPLLTELVGALLDAGRDRS